MSHMSGYATNRDLQHPSALFTGMDDSSLAGLMQIVERWRANSGLVLMTALPRHHGIGIR